MSVLWEFSSRSLRGMRRELRFVDALSRRDRLNAAENANDASCHSCGDQTVHKDQLPSQV